MKPQERRQRAQRNQAIALQIVMMLAGLGIGTYFLLQVLDGEPERRDFYMFATFGCYGVAAFYAWLSRHESDWREGMSAPMPWLPGLSRQK